MFYKYPKTAHFNDVVAEMNRKASFGGLDENGEPIVLTGYTLPTVTFTSTIKIHGTNAGVALTKATNKLSFQSRNRELDLGNDNAGFCSWGMQPTIKEVFEQYLTTVQSNHPDYDAVAVFGEWAGANIQPTVAVTNLPKSFFTFEVFGINLTKDKDGNDAQELTPILDVPALHHPEHNIHSVAEFEMREWVVDFNQPEQVQNDMVAYTLEVEQECPVAKAFGFSGVGEGIVCRAMVNGKRICFKVKGEKHSTSKVRVLKDVDTVAIQAIRQLAQDLVTERRYEQGIEYLKEMGLPVSQQSTGEFIKWVNNDVLAEEQETIAKSGYEFKAIARYLSQNSKHWFFTYLQGQHSS